MDNFDLKKYLVENKITTNSQLEEASALSIEPYTAENPSGEFEYKVLYYEPGKNQPTYQSLHKYLPTLSGAFLVLNSAKKIGVNTTDGKIANKVEPRTVVDKSGKTVDFKDESREDARAAFSKAGYRDYTGNQVGNINEAVLSKDNFDLKKYLVENKITTNSQMLNESVEVPAWLKGKLEDVHVKPGQGSIFAKSVDEILKLAQNLLDKTDPKQLDKIANSTGTLTMNVPGVGYNLVLPVEQAKKLPGAQASEVEKQEGPNKVKVPAVNTTAPLTQFKTNELTVIVRPKKDEAGTVIPNEYIVLSVFPGDPDIPRASEWGGKYAVILPKS
jgi:hypothetical protein